MPTLNWIGKRAVEKHHLEIPYRLLEYDESLSVGDEESGNLLVQGDNLHALKALLPYYAGKVKCIYIDPPYNTGNEGWQYNDNVSSPEIKDWLNKVVGSEGEDLSRHDKWLCMMYPRLQLLRKLLNKDGSIFISIDDNESHYLKLLMDEIFGRRNFVANVVWQKRTSPDFRATIGAGHDHILVYAKDIIKFKSIIKPLKKSSDQKAAYKNPDSDPKGSWASSDFTAQGFRPNQMYKIITPSGKVYEPPEGRCWKNIESVFLKLVEEGRIWFGKNGDGVPRRKTYLAESVGQIAWSWWPNSEVGHNQEAKKELIEILGAVNVFDTPKPVRLIRRIIELSTNKNDIVLDSFAGSGTTGHSVMELNKEDDGKRKFILVEIEEKISKEVTAERLKKVINGYAAQKQSGSSENIQGLGGGFRYCKLGEPLFDKFGNVREGVKFKELARHIFFSENGVPLSEKTKLNTPLIGIYKGVGYYLLFNGILGDKTVNGGNVLTSRILESLPKHNGAKIIFGEANRISSERLKQENIVFKQIPYEIKTV